MPFKWFKSTDKLSKIITITVLRFMKQHYIILSMLIIVILCGCEASNKVAIYTPTKPYYFPKLYTSKYKGYIEPKGYSPWGKSFWDFHTPKKDVTIAQISEAEKSINKIIGKIVKEDGVELNDYWRIYRPWGNNAIRIEYYLDSIPDELSKFPFVSGDDFFGRPQHTISITYDFNTHKVVESNYKKMIIPSISKDKTQKTDIIIENPNVELDSIPHVNYPKVTINGYEGFIDNVGKYYIDKNDKNFELNGSELNITEYDAVQAENLIKKIMSKDLKKWKINLSEYWRFYMPAYIIEEKKILYIYYIKGECPEQLHNNPRILASFEAEVDFVTNEVFWIFLSQEQ